VDPTYELAHTERKNVAESLTSVKLKRYGRGLKVFKFLPLRIKKIGHKWIERLSNHPPSLSSSAENYLASHYYSHNRDLAKLTGRDLAVWEQ
jgi:hypothetical protein